MDDALDQQPMLDEDDDDSDDDDFDDDNQDDEARQLFQAQCQRIEANDRTFRVLDVEFSFNNEMAIHLGRSLSRNTHLEAMVLYFNLELTAHAVDTLVHGLQSSKLKSLELLSRFELPVVMAPLYTQTTNLQKLDLLFPMDDHGATLLGDSLRRHPALEEIILLISLITPQCGARALAKGICESNLSTLDLVMDATEADVVAENMRILIQASQGSSSIQNMALTGHIGNMNALPAMPHLLRLSIISQVLSELSSLKIFSNTLQQITSNMISLCLCNCGLGDEHMRILAQFGGIGNHPSVKTLCITGNPLLGDAGIAAFVQHWHETSLLRDLSFSRNSIGPRGARLLIQAISHHSKVRNLDLSDNQTVGYDGLVAIGRELNGTKLKTVVLNRVAKWVEYDDDNESKEAVLQRTKCAEAGQALVDGVRGNVHLAVLDLDENHLAPAIKAEVKVVLTANRCGRCLLARQDTLPLALWPHFLSAKNIRKCNILFLCLRELPTLVLGQSR